jgi:hypothetical protein
MKGIGYTRKASWTTLFVLGVLFLRALVPAGFMLAPVGGSLAFVLCDAETQGPAHHHHPGMPPGMHSDRTCPYAQSAGPAPLPALPVLAGGVVYDVPVPRAAVTQTFLSFGPPRQQSSRGPPTFA